MVSECEIEACGQGVCVLLLTSLPGMRGSGWSYTGVGAEFADASPRLPRPAPASRGHPACGGQDRPTFQYLSSQRRLQPLTHE